MTKFYEFLGKINNIHFPKVSISKNGLKPTHEDIAHGMPIYQKDVWLMN